MKLSGKLIAFEGIDGSGKGTQSKRLYQYLKKINYKVSLFEFPNYSETFFGREVGHYLNGKFGKIDEVDPKLSAILYAGDRYEKRDEIVEKLKLGYTIICDRYIPSNIAHQVSKIKNNKSKLIFKNWIKKLEYKVYKLPKEDIVIFMDMNPISSNTLVLKKDRRSYTNKKKDLHESDQEYLFKVYKTFKELSKGKNWININCEINGKLKNIDEIHFKIIENLEGKT